MRAMVLRERGMLMETLMLGMLVKGRMLMQEGMVKTRVMKETDMCIPRTNKIAVKGMMTENISKCGVCR